MIRWLWNLIVGKPACARECAWETIDTINVWDGLGGSRPIAFEYVLRCKTCGDIKSRRVG